jgi:hypothetical protein
MFRGFKGLEVGAKKLPSMRRGFTRSSHNMRRRDAIGELLT